MGKIKTNRIGSPWNREAAKPQKPGWGPVFWSLKKFQPAGTWAKQKRIESEAPGTARGQSHKNPDGARLFELKQFSTSRSMGREKTNRIGSPWDREAAKPQKPRWGPVF